MTLPTSGALGLLNISNEFGGAAPDGLSEYYRGGSYVPSDCEGTGGLLPSSGEVRIGDFYGACQAVPPPSTDIAFYGDGPLQYGIFGQPANTGGYSYYCLQTQTGVYSPGFGAYSGSRFLNGGYVNEGFYSMVYMEETNLAVYGRGLQMIMFNATYMTTKYRFDVSIYTNNGGSPGTLRWSGTLYSDNALSDVSTTVKYGSGCGSSKSARALYFSLGSGGPGVAGTDFYIDATITRTYPV